MTIDDSERFTALLELAGETSNETVSPARSVLYFNILKRFDFNVIERAIEIYYGVGDKFRRFPQPNQLVEIIEGSEEDAESRAWNIINDAMRKIGSHKSLIVEDTAIAEALLVTFGSWRDFGELSEIALTARRKDFIAAYRQARAVTRANGGERAPRMLAGRQHAENALNRHVWPGFDAKAYFGIIHVDGRIEERYLDIEQTGLPAAPLADVLALPPATEHKALSEAPSTDDDRELAPEEARQALSEAFQRVMAGKTMPAAGPRPLTRDEERERERLKDLREQQRILRKEARDGQGSNALPAQEAPSTGRLDRAANEGGEAADAGTGVQVCESAGPKVGV